MISLIAFEPAASQAELDRFEYQRHRMVIDQIKRRGISDQRVLAAMLEIPRHHFVPASIRTQSYEDRPLPIGYGQTISQPYMVSFMTEQLKLKPTDRVLEIGTGSGYQTAILSKLVDAVYSIEAIDTLAQSARIELQQLGIKNIFIRCCDGYHGWPEEAPFEAILVAAAPDHVPTPLTDQLKEGGRMVIPIGLPQNQHLVLIERCPDGLRRRRIGPVAFVPFVHQE